MTLKRIDESKLQAYDIVSIEDIEELNTTGYQLKHKKTGANVVLMVNDDENKVFTIGFRTPPESDAGLPHILEHSVLCGSKKYPSKNPFEELVQGSLNTFLNAMTYPDKTIYPVASCNDKDFKNLMSVYLDAVFYPNVTHTEEIFKQEGWHYELKNREDNITYNGVVFNEMKGAFSDPDGLVFRYVNSELFPDTCYGYESGGDPEAIPSLSYEEFVSFHKKYYHPSNSYIYLYGDMDMIERLDYIDREYLCAFDKLEIDSQIKSQTPFEKAKYVEKTYPIGSDEDDKDKGYLSYNTTAGTALDREFYYAFKVLSYALLNMPGAPLKKALIEAGIGKQITGGYSDGINQCSFGINAKNVDVDKRDEFVRIIEDTLRDIVKNGIDKDSLKGALNVMEFQYREADFGSYPRGLFYGMYILDSWLYDENQPFINVKAAQTFEKLNELAKTGYFEELISKYILDNNHKLIFSLKPEKGLQEKKDKEVADKLAAYKASLTEDEITKLIEDTEALEKYQSEPSSKEDTQKLPVLEISDIKKEPKLYSYEKKDMAGTPVIYSDVFSNGIAYIKASFDCKHMPKKLIPYAALLQSVLGFMDTKNYKYSQLNNEINMHTGGMSTQLAVYNELSDSFEYSLRYDVDVKAFYNEIPKAFELMKETVLNTVMDDEKRIKEILDELAGKIRTRIISAGHLSALYRALSYISEPGYITDKIYGIGYYEFVNDIVKNVSIKEIIENLKKIAAIIFDKKNLILNITAQKEGYEIIENSLHILKDELYYREKEISDESIVIEQKNEGIIIPSPVSYVARVGNFKKAGYKYSGTLLALKNALDYGYLWNNVRVLGGAYGTMSIYQSAGGNMGYMSYRDPNVKKTSDTYLSVPQYLESFEADERELRKYIIGAIANLDTPLSARGEGERNFTAYITKRNNEELKKEREDVLTLDVNKIKESAKIIRDVLAQGNICVVGNKEKIEEAKELFKETKEIFE